MLNNIKKTVKSFVTREGERQRKVKAIAKWLSANAQIIDVQGVDFNYLSHDRTVALMKAIKARTWTKSYNTTINYTTKIQGFTIRICNSAPPPNCKIVEEPEFVPEYKVEAHTVTRRKIVCDKTVAEA